MKENDVARRDLVAFNTLKAVVFHPWVFLLCLQPVGDSCTYQILLLQLNLAAVGILFHHVAGNPWIWDDKDKVTVQLQVTMRCHVDVLKPGVLI